MPSSPISSRRSLLAAGAAALATLGGCSRDAASEDGTSNPADSATSTATDGSPGTKSTTDEATSRSTPAGTDTPGGANDGSESATETPSSAATSTADLDLREANVVGVEFEGGNGTYDFSVALHHDDDGEDGYANWWQVESLDGDQLGRRTLLHAHSRQPFTRSETIDVPAGTTCVVVRGHDQTHGYGGQAMVVNLETGATRRVDQGPDPVSLSDATCP